MDRETGGFCGVFVCYYGKAPRAGVLPGLSGRPQVVPALSRGRPQASSALLETDVCGRLRHSPGIARMSAGISRLFRDWRLWAANAATPRRIGRQRQSHRGFGKMTSIPRPIPAAVIPRPIPRDIVSGDSGPIRTVAGGLRDRSPVLSEGPASAGAPSFSRNHSDVRRRPLIPRGAGVYGRLRYTVSHPAFLFLFLFLYYFCTIKTGL